MANSKRREKFTDSKGNMLIPANVDGGQYSENFFNTYKFLGICAIVIGLAITISKCNSGRLSVLGCIVLIALWLFVSSLIVRFVIFEEKFYYRMYNILKEHEITTPALFWDIASIKDTDEGAIITYSDAKIAIMVRLESDTITGKSRDFKEVHYDAISDFYRDVINQGYKFVQLNIMEQAGKDTRLNELSKLTYKSDNPNIQKLMELQIGYIKNISHSSLYESDYFLFYTNELSKVDSIITDITESLFKILDGAYSSYSILSSKEIVDLLKDEFGINYFNATEASLLMYNNNINGNICPYNITGLIWTDGNVQTLTQSEINKLRDITSRVINETLSISDMAIKETIYREEVNNKIGVDFESLSKNAYKMNNRHKENNNIKSNKVKLSKNNDNINTNKNIDKSELSNNKSKVSYDNETNNDEYIDI